MRAPVRTRAVATDGRSPGLRVNALPRTFPARSDGASGLLHGRLAAHSCGGSRGFPPRSLFTAGHEAFSSRPGGTIRLAC